MAATKKTQLQDSDAVDLDAVHHLVRPGLGEQDAIPDHDRTPTEGERLRAFVDISAPSPERKRAILELGMWGRQEEFLTAYGSLGTVAHACEASQVSQRTVRDWRTADRLGFLARMDGASESFGDRLLALAFNLVSRLRPGQSPILLISMLNYHVRGFRPATVLDEGVGRDTLSALRQLASTGTAAGDPPDDRGAAAVAEAERLLSTRATPGPRDSAEDWTDGGHRDHRDHRDRDPGPDPEESGPSGAQ